MQRERLNTIGSEKKRRWLLIVCALSLLCLSQSALAQSGRRQNKNVSPPPPPVAPEPKTETEVKPPVVKPDTSATIIVGGDKFGSSIYILSAYVDAAMVACMDRLRKSAGLEVTGGGNMSRKEAMDRAKKEQEAHVLWLEVRVEEDGTGDASVAYTLFAPQTAKNTASGRVYLGTQRVGGGTIGVGVPSSRRLPLEYQLRDAGRTVADRVIGKLISRPTEKPEDQ